MAHLLQQTLQEIGYSVDIALDGEDGLDKLNSNTYDLVTLDIVMPKISGLDVLRRFKKTGKKQGKIVMLNNLNQRQVIEEAFECGADGYELTSNVTPGDLPKLVKSYLDGSISKRESKKRALKTSSKTLNGN